MLVQPLLHALLAFVLALKPPVPALLFTQAPGIELGVVSLIVELLVQLAVAAGQVGIRSLGRRTGLVDLGSDRSQSLAIGLALLLKALALPIQSLALLLQLVRTGRLALPPGAAAG